MNLAVAFKDAQGSTRPRAGTSIGAKSVTMICAKDALIDMKRFDV